MRTIYGTIKPTNTEWLPVLCNIQPSDLRTKEAPVMEYRQIVANTILPIHEYYIERAKFKSRIPF